MKNTSTLILLCLMLTSAAYGQMRWKFKAGATATFVSFNNEINDQSSGGTYKYGSKYGFVIGLAAAIPLSGDRFYLQPELLFHQKGYSSDFYYASEASSYIMTLNYLDVPVLAKATFGKFFLSAGPYFAWGLGGKYKGTNTYAGITYENEGKVKFGERPDGYSGSNDYVNAFDFGFAGGAGVKIRAVAIELRFGLGLLDLRDKDYLDSPMRNRSLQLTAEFPLLFK